MDTDQELFPYYNWVVAAILAATIVLGANTIFNSDTPEATNAQPCDAQLIEQTNRADVLHSNLVQPWWHLMLERVLMVEKI